MQVEEKSTPMSPPEYEMHGGADSERYIDSKERSICPAHDSAETPYLDSWFRKPTLQQSLLALAQSLTDAANNERCTRCAIEDSVRTLTQLGAEAKKAKKESKLLSTKEEKKAMKQEVKGVMKAMKPEIKRMWKEAEKKE